jgi:AraC-like DNA-binding protein
MHQNIFKAKLTVGWMKECCYINGHNFSARFKYFLRLTPKQYIVHHRLEAAKKLLRHPGLQEVSLSTIALEVGFNSLSSFDMIFKEYIGCKPSEYRFNHSTI